MEVEVDAVLFARFGSVVDELTTAVLFTIPVADGAINPSIKISREEPEVKLPRANEPVQLSQLVPLSREYNGLIIELEIKSVSITFRATEGPLLPTFKL